MSAPSRQITRAHNAVKTHLRHAAAALPDRIKRPEGGRQIALRLALAEAFGAVQSHAEAAEQLALVLASQPDHAAAHLGYITALEAQERWPDAAAAIGAARRALPEQAAALRARHVTALQNARRFSEAALVLQESVAEAPDDLAAQMQLGQLLVQGQDFGGAAKVFGQLRAATPEAAPLHAEAWLGQMNALARGGDLAQVVAETEDVAGRPGAAEPWLFLMRHRARAQAGLGQQEAAAATLAAALKAAPAQSEAALALRLEQAQLALAEGRLEAAAGAYDAILAQTPGHGGARLGRVELALRQGETARALALLKDAVIAPNADAPPPGQAARMIDRQRLVARYAALMLQEGQATQLEAQLPQLTPYLDRLSEAGLIELMRGLEHSAPQDLARALLERLLERPHLSLTGAGYLAELALRCVGPAPARAFERLLEARVAKDQRRIFRAEMALHQQGPEAALRLARADTEGRPRSAVEAAQLGFLLLETGRLLLAMRYLRRALARWPEDRPLKERLFNTYLRAGAFAPAEALLPQITEPGSHDRAARQLSVLFNAGRLTELAALLDQQTSPAEVLLGVRGAMRLYLALGRLAEAEALIPAVVKASKGRSLSKFMVTQLGAMINEQRLWQSFGPQDTAGQGHAFYYPAKCVVDAWTEARGAVDYLHDGALQLGVGTGKRHARRAAKRRKTAIPLHVMQYWDKPQLPPGIAKLMTGWRRAPGFDYTRLDRQGALVFLRAHLGEEARRAFLLANNVAEECDFLRLAWLYVHGGIYADADDKRTGPLGLLLAAADTACADHAAGAEAVVFRENVGSISNNILMACPGHPLIAAAMGMVQASLLARENDNTWSKTGPGLMTRAVAGYIEGPHRGVGLAVLPKPVMHVAIWPHAKLPHKATTGHWNTDHSGVAPSLQRVFAAQIKRLTQEG